MCGGKIQNTEVGFSVRCLVVCLQYNLSVVLVKLVCPRCLFSFFSRLFILVCRLFTLAGNMFIPTTNPLLSILYPAVYLQLIKRL